MGSVYTEELIFRQAPRRNVVRKNKLIVLLLDAFGFGYMGLDRIYLGCYLSGVLKFSIAVFSMLLLFTPNVEAQLVGGMLLVVSLVWNLIDTFTIFYNAITEQRGVPFIFCRSDKPMMWKDQQNIVDGKNFGLALMLIYIILHAGAFNGFNNRFKVMEVTASP